jgi:glutamyl-tRNA reductase
MTTMTQHTRKPCQSAQQSCASELQHALEKLRTGTAPEQVVETLSQRLTKRLLHLPTKAIANAG